MPIIVNLNLSPRADAYVMRRAAKAGVSPGTYIETLLSEYLSGLVDNERRATIDRLRAGTIDDEAIEVLTDWNTEAKG